MPIYEYQCADCGHLFDALQKMSDAALTDCPDCGKPALRKLLSAPNFRLKGGGWYETDFKSGNKRNLAGEAGKADKPDSKKVDLKPADAKPAAPKSGDSKSSASTSSD